MNEHFQRVEADLVVSVSELKKNPSAVFTKASENAMGIAVLNHNKVVGYVLPPDVYEALLEELDDFRLVEIVKERMNEPTVSVDINDL
ncbi:MAG: prevent-host-death protein [Devosia sp.]|uniref:type II toxin-antitoxin system Phd/YefM family antitoxin n=1 Tax=Devosia sp. TaxID=1871048 RepID=UPI00263359AE|nr:type II toxin-antitoxin system Phd/YefM family antitoxin [Devosia sp.]MDB5528937.1 prevent-host-death protein [Devosia sp.]